MPTACEISELGQINLNASIAERLGFTIDSKTVNRQVERIDEDGIVLVETGPVRRTAYFLPKKIRNILHGDACYGSNINRSRFMEYIEECMDTTPPVEDRPFKFDYPVFFAGKSLKWGG